MLLQAFRFEPFALSGGNKLRTVGVAPGLPDESQHDFLRNGSTPEVFGLVSTNPAELRRVKAPSGEVSSQTTTEPQLTFP